MKTRSFLVLGGLFLLGFLGPLDADPRWWWHDRPLLPPGPDRAWPDVSVTDTEQQGLAPVFFVYSEWDDDSSNWDVWLTATPNAGCGFCDPVRITDNALDDIKPRVAAVERIDGHIDLQVVVERGIDVVAIWDTTINTALDMATFCRQLDTSANLILTNDQEISLPDPLPGFVYSNPDISGVSIMGGQRAHFHAVFQLEQNGIRKILYTRDFDGGGGLNWEDGISLLGGLGTPPEGAYPVVVADRFGFDIQQSGVSVAFTLPGMVDTGHFRTFDSGSTWSELEFVTDNDSGATGRPAIDSMVTDGGGGDVLWVGAAFLDNRGGFDHTFFDAKLYSVPGGGGFGWSFDQPLQSSLVDDAGTVSVAMLPYEQGGGFGDQVHVFWDEPYDDAGREVYYRGGVACSICAFPQANMTQAAFRAQRPFDTVVSESEVLSSCVLNESDYTCQPSRLVGEATQVSSSGRKGTEEVYVVWRDTREGVGNIYFKRSDTGIVEPTFGSLATSCSPSGEARVQVDWVEGGTCEDSGGAVAEHFERFLVYYGTQPGGPYENADSPIEVQYQSGVVQYSALIEDLLRGTEYSILVVAEDEARNVLPLGFDPRILNGVIEQENTIRTIDTCPSVCLHKTEILDLGAYDPDQLYVSPRTPEDLALQSLPYLCPVVAGDRDSDAIGNGMDLTLYQLAVPTTAFRLRRSGRDVRFEF